MKKLLLSALLFCLSTSAWADGTIDSLGAAGAIAGTESIPVFQTANPALKTTPNALDTYLSQTTKALTNKTINCANNTCTGLPISTGVSGLGTGVATFLGTPSAANFLTMTGVLGLGSMAALPSSNFFAGDAGGRPIAASVTGDLGFGAAAAGFVTGTVTGLRGISLDASPSNGQVPVYRSSGNHIAWEAAGAGSGTVTSVAASVPASSILGVSGSPITASGTLALTTTGTSGGIPYFFDGNTLKTSAALTANLPVIGGGAGATPAVGTRSGNTTAFVTTTGTQTSGDCVKIDANGNHVAQGSACGGASSLTVTDGTNSVASTTTLAFGSGLLVGGSAGTATLNSTNTLNTQSGTGAYAILATDGGLQIVRTNASGGADTIGAASATGFTAGFSTMYTTGSFAGNTITPALGTIGGLSVLKFGKYQSGSLDSDNTNYNVALSYPVPPDQTGSRFNLSSMLWTAAFTDGQIPVGQTGAAILPKTMSGDATLAASGALTVVSATTSTAGKAKLHNIPVSIGWPAGLDPNNTVIAVINQASTISAIVGALETANGATATVTVNKAGSGTACSAGSAVSSAFNANSTAATNQTLTSGSQTLAVGDRLCLQTTGTWTGGGGSGIGTISVFLAPS